MTLTEEERFWTHVQRTPTCWLWTGALFHNGYGIFTRAGRVNVRAHRYSYELRHGPIADGLTIDHLCRTRSCVNPDHLEPVSLRENILRGDGPAARHAVQTHCLRGHEFTPENTRVAQGRRHCRACERGRARAGRG